MAINDDLRTPDRNRMTDAREGMGMLPIIIGVLAAVLLAWWLFSYRIGPSNTGTTTRSSAPVTGAPTSGSNTNTNTSNPGTSKQP